jgi:hypothetical protein
MELKKPLTILFGLGATAQPGLRAKFLPGSCSNFRGRLVTHVTAIHHPQSTTQTCLQQKERFRA